MTDKTPLVTTSRDALAEVMRDHVLGGDTAAQYDTAGQCSCGQKFYESGGSPAAYLLANRRLLDAHAAHVVDALLASGVVRAVDGLAEDEALMRRVAVAEYGELLSEAAQIAGARLVQPHVRALAKVLADG